MTDYEIILTSAIRYALGRRTYIVKLTVDYVIGELDKLSENCKNVIKKDIIEQSRLGLGDECDRDDWCRLLRKLADNEAEPTSSKMEQVAKNATTTNGDCSTCKHYASKGSITICDTCFIRGGKEYEPYIPNPIEKEFIVHNKEDWDRFIADVDKE